MVDPQLLAYVAQQRTAGYSDEQIAQALEAQGYPASLVNAALKDATMAALRSYVDTYRAQGYADLQIRQGLVQQGHTARDIDAVLGRGAHASKALLLFPIIAILILAGGYYLLNAPFFENLELLRLLMTAVPSSRKRALVISSSA